MSDREGPKASIELTCYGCRHHTRHGTGAAITNYCSARGGDRWKGEWSGRDTPPDWCPHLPGALVAVPVSVATDLNVTRGEIVSSARALGQEIKDA